MLSLDKIEQTILELEQQDTTFATCDRLAPLYIVRDHLRGYNVAPEAALALAASSEFLQAVNGKSPEKVLQILDPLMEAVHTMHPRMYDKIMDQIKEA